MAQQVVVGGILAQCPVVGLTGFASKGIVAPVPWADLSAEKWEKVEQTNLRLSSRGTLPEVDRSHPSGSLFLGPAFWPRLHPPTIIRPGEVDP